MNKVCLLSSYYLSLIIALVANFTLSPDLRRVP